MISYAARCSSEVVVDSDDARQKEGNDEADQTATSRPINDGHAAETAALITNGTIGPDSNAISKEGIPPPTTPSPSGIYDILLMQKKICVIATLLQKNTTTIYHASKTNIQGHHLIM